MSGSYRVARPEGRLPGYFSLFGSLGTLVCCALPSLLVLLGFGTTVAAILAELPWLVTLSRHKAWVFAGAGALMVGNAYYIHRLASALQARAGGCPPEDQAACKAAARWSRRILAVSGALYLAGFFVAYGLGPLLSWLER
ncbi:MAG TPA: hypothetical protein VI383_07845 [Gemmatimonadales bacterium]|nr:hypothetical protein [Gemmatimonadales bacterium]